MKADLVEAQQAVYQSVIDDDPLRVPEAEILVTLAPKVDRILSDIRFLRIARVAVATMIETTIGVPAAAFDRKSEALSSRLQAEDADLVAAMEWTFKWLSHRIDLEILKQMVDIIKEAHQNRFDLLYREAEEAFGGSSQFDLLSDDGIFSEYGPMPLALSSGVLPIPEPGDTSMLSSDSRYLTISDDPHTITSAKSYGSSQSDSSYS